MADATRTAEILLRSRDRTRAGYRSAERGARQFADNSTGSVERVNASFLNLRNIIAGTGAMMAARAVFEPTIDMEQVETQFGVLFQSVDEGQRKIAELIEFAATTPLQFGLLKGGVQQLKGAMVAAEEIIPTLRMLGDIGMGDAEKVGRLVNAFSKLKLKGRATMEELNMFLEAGVPILDALQKRYDLNGVEMAKMIERGKVGFADVRDELRKMTEEGGQFNRMMEKMSTTAAGRISTMKDVFKLGLTDIGTEALDEAGEVIEELIAKMTELRESGQLQEWGQALGRAIEEAHDRLQGIAAWIRENEALLKTVGFTYAGVRTIQAITGAAKGLQAAIVALTAVKTAETGAEVANTGATVANTAAKGANTAATHAQAAASLNLRLALTSVKGVLGTVAAAGATAFVGWKIGNLLGELTGLNKALGEIGEAVALKKQKTGLEMFREQWAARFDGDLDARDAQGRSWSDVWRAIQKRDQERRAGIRKPEAEESDAADKDGAAQPALSDKAREKVAAELQKAAEKELARRAKIADKIEAKEKDIAEAREDARRRRAEEELEAIRDRARARADELEKAARAEGDKAREKERAFADAWARLLMPADERKAADKEASEQKKREDELERRLASAKERDAAGLSVTKRGRELIEADKLRQQAAAAKQNEKQLQEQAAEARKQLAMAQAKLSDLTAVQIDAEKELTKAIQELRDALADDGGTIGGREAAGLSDEQLRRVAKHGREITEGTDEAKKQRADEAQVMAEVLGEGGQDAGEAPWWLTAIARNDPGLVRRDGGVGNAEKMQRRPRRETPAEQVAEETPAGGRDLRDRAAERAKSRREAYLADASRRMAEGAFLPRALQEEVAEWRKAQGQGPAAAAGMPQPAMVAPMMPPVVPVAAAEESFRGDEILRELRGINGKMTRFGLV